MKKNKLMLGMALALALGVGMSVATVNSVAADEVNAETQTQAPIVTDKGTVYEYEIGSTVNNLNGFNGTIFSDYDAVNINALVGGRYYGLENSYKYAVGGVTLKGINADVASGKYLVLTMQNIYSAQKDGISVAVNGVTMASSAYYIDGQNGGMEAVAAATSVSLPVYKNAKVTKVNVGFAGEVYIPMSAFEGVTKIESVTVSTGLAFTNINVGEVYLADVNADTLAVSNKTSIWQLGEANWETYTSTLAEGTKYTWEEIFACTALDAGQFVYGYGYAKAAVDNYYNGTATELKCVETSPSVFMEFPSDMVASDGLVHLKELGVKGFAVDVEFYDTETPSMQFALRMGGETNTNLDYKDSVVVYQTSNSRSNQRRILSSGLVKGGNTSYLPASADVQTCTVYIPMEYESFTGYYPAEADPDVVQPVMQLFYDKTKVSENYTVKFSNVRFVTDETPYDANLIATASANGVLQGYVGETPIGTNSNNKVITGTTVNFEITPNKGYKATTLSITEEGKDPVEVPVGADGKISYVVNTPITVMANYEIAQYKITYVLDGGENNADNPETYNYMGGAELADPTKGDTKFLGWYTTADFSGDPITEIEDMTGDITLYAKWEEKGNAKGDETIGGCSGSIVGLGSVTTILAAAAVVLVKKSKKD